MEDTSGKIIKGCGIGCAVIFGLVILILVIGYFKVKDKISEFKEFEELGTVIESKFGKVEEYVPVVDPEKFNERLERFISIRKELLPNAEKLDDRMSELEGVIVNHEESFWDAIDIMSSGLEFIPELLHYYKARNDVFIRYEMGLGEYYYNYVIVYYAYLNKSPGDGPEFNLSNSISVELKEEQPGTSRQNIKEERDERIRKQVNRYFRIFYRNLINDFNNSISDNDMEMIENEMNKLKENKFRIPWEEGVPDNYLSILKQNRDLLDSLYRKNLNPVEMNEMSQ